MRILLTLRTLRHVRPVQVWNRIWRKRLSLRCPSRPSASTSLLPEFRFLNVTGRPNGWNDPRFEKLWLYNLHYFDYLNRQPSASSLVSLWIRENPKGWGNGWEPYPTSLRIVNWVKWLTQRIGESEDEARAIEASLKEQVAWLERRLEYHLLANHLLANAKALVFGGVYFQTRGRGGVERLGRRWLEKGLEIYRKELPEQICTDGVHFERSPMYHCIILEDLLDCVACLDTEVLRNHAEKMLAGLKLLTGPDGRIAKFNDATEGIAKTPAELFESATNLGLQPSTSTFNLPSSASISSGFVRIEKGAYCLLAKMGEIGPRYQPGHAHADTGTFELWKDGRKIVGDTGCSTYVPGPVRAYERSTVAHNCVTVDGRDSSEVWAAHRVARRAKILARKTDRQESEAVYRDYRGFEIRRRLELTEEGLRGVDEIRGSGEHCVEVRFHLPPDVKGDDVRLTCNGERRVESCEFAAGWNRRELGKCLICRQTARLPLTFTWLIS